MVVFGTASIVIYNGLVHKNGEHVFLLREKLVQHRQSPSVHTHKTVHIH